LVGGEAFSIDASLIKADVDKKKRMPGHQPIAWPKAEEASHAVREYLAALDTAPGYEGGGGDAGSSGEGGDRAKPPKEVSLTDPQATWVARPSLHSFFAYNAIPYPQQGRHPEAGWAPKVFSSPRKPHRRAIDSFWNYYGLSRGSGDCIGRR
jgi:hypothetical protein